MKVTLLGDTHFDVSNSSEIVYAQQIKFFKEQFFPYLKENNIKDIIQLGDFLDNKTKIGTFIQYHLMKDFFDVLVAEGITMHYFPGNHDIYYRDSREIYSLAIFEKAYPKNFKVYNTMSLAKFGSKEYLLVPWMYTEELPKLLEIISEYKPDAIFGHFEISDFYMGKNAIDSHGLNKKLFKEIPVYSGHYHLKQIDENIHYIGTPYQTSWTDYNEEKGFYTLETESNELTFIENVVTSKHLQVFVNIESKELTIEGFCGKVISGDLSDKKIDYTLFKNQNVKIFIDKDNAATKKIVEKIIEQCNKYKVKMSCIESEDGETLEVETTEVDYHEFDITGSIKDRLPSEFQIETFEQIHLETLKQIQD